MSLPAFVQDLAECLRSKTPMAFYRKPGEEQIHAIFQQTPDLWPINTWREEGFFIAPFQKENQAFYIAGDQKKVYSLGTTIPKAPLGFNGQSSISALDYQTLIQQAQAEIQNGIFKKVVLSRQLVGDYPETEISHLYHRLLTSYPQAFCYCFFHPQMGLWIGASPEIFLSLNDNRIKTMALAGTKSIMDRDIPWGEKEIQEQIFVEDHIREQLSTLLNPNQILEGERSEVVAGPVLHLCTRFEANAQNLSLFELTKLLHPTPAVCGYPTLEAFSFIAQHESDLRELYTGFIGPKFGETSDFYVNLRCAAYKNGILRCYVGGGITEKSQSEAEWIETERKAQTFLQVL